MKATQKQLVTIFLLFVLVFSQFAYPKPASAASIRYVVASGGLTTGQCESWGLACTLERALTVASGGDEVWVQQGTYKPGTARTDTFIIKDGVDVYGGFLGTEILRSERNPNPANTILSGDIGDVDLYSDNSFHVVTIDNAGESTVLDGFTVTRGYVTDGDGNAYGGGIYVTNSSPILNNLIITDNHAGSTVGSGGGGIYIDGPPTIPLVKPIISNVTFFQNYSGRGGGLFSQRSSPALTNVVFEENEALATGGGGANFQNLQPTDPYINPVLTDVSFINNKATGGGGMFLGTSSGSLTNVTFSGNTAKRRGGGLLLEFSTAVLTNVTFYNNTSNNLLVEPKGGGGLMVVASSPTLNNVTFNSNTSDGNGDAMRNTKDQYSPATGYPVIRNAVFWGNNTAEITSDETGTITINDSIVKGGCPAFTGVTCTNVVDADPVLGALANNGGFTQTMALGTGSPAINAGNNSTCASTDQRGVTRPQGLACDMGAYEALTYVLTVTTVGNGTVTRSNPGPYFPGDIVDLTAVPDPGFSFIGWSGACIGTDACQVTMDGNKSVTANFTYNTYTLIVNKIGSGSGVVTSDPVGIDCGETCSADFMNNSAVTLTAVADNGSTFTGWNIGRCAGSNTCTVTMANSRTVTVAFSIPLTALAPSGSMASFNNIFTWSGVNPAATDYILEVYTAAGTPLIAPKWLTTSQAGCVAPDLDCTATVALGTLASGDYKWRVRDYDANYASHGLWTEYQTFTILPPLPLGPLTTILPSGPQATFNHIYTWSGVTRATTYVLEVYTAGGTKLIAPKWMTASQAGCVAPDLDCTTTVALGNLAIGDYKWRVRAYDTATGTYGDWTEYQTFTILPLGPLTTILPSGPQASFNHIYTWSGVTRATTYILEVYTASGTKLIAPKWMTASQAGCVAPDLDCTTTVSLGNLAIGDYKWRVRAYDNVTYTYGDWTEYQTFTILPLGPLVTILPSGSMASFNNIYTWSGVTRATTYVLEVYTASGTKLIAPKWMTASQAGCVAPDLDCTTTVALGTLATGEYKWRVRAYDNVTYTYGDWTDYQTFTVQP